MTAMLPIEVIGPEKAPYAYVVRCEFSPARTTFVTPDTLNQQLGFIVYGAGTQIPRHRHLQVARSIEGTTEVILVKQGRCIADIFDQEGRPVDSVELRVGDIIVLSRGGHGFRIVEDTVLIEVKQGPYSQVVDKERF